MQYRARCNVAFLRQYITNVGAKLVCLSQASRSLMFVGKASSGLYYKHITIVIDTVSVVSKWRSKL